MFELAPKICSSSLTASMVKLSTRSDPADPFDTLRPTSRNTTLVVLLSVATPLKLADSTPVEEKVVSTSNVVESVKLAPPSELYCSFSCVGPVTRSEEHTSELQSRFGISYAVFCL